MSSAFTLDKRQLRRSFERAASTYDRAAVLQREICERALERLDLVKLAPAVILDAGSGTGFAAHSLARRYPDATLVELDIAPAMLRTARARLPRWKKWIGRRRELFVCGDNEHLPIRAGTVAMFWSNLAFQWANDLPLVLSECQRVLQPGGLLTFTTFGPDTLKELRQAFAGDAGRVHVNRFYDMHDIGDMLVHAGFADPVMDMEQVTLTYADVETLMRELKAIGAHNVATGRSRGLTGRRTLDDLRRRYEQLRRDGRLPATFEVVYGHAWKPMGHRLPAGVKPVKVHLPQRESR
ncbi:MAG TPA: malonyl-ACP O-methyltransferase BioC [Burkholderiales bacterium]|nr:malonyl-ACP O-methyltransferase BioC [Burkholderiales bacterium]